VQDSITPRTENESGLAFRSACSPSALGSILRGGKEALQALWLKSRVREVVWGILGGSIAGTLFPAGRTWIATTFKQIVGDVSEHVPNFRGPAIVAMLAIFCACRPFPGKP
jgi:hypothetical protein